jgi:hypothetical protein
MSSRSGLESMPKRNHEKIEIKAAALESNDSNNKTVILADSSITRSY